MKRTDLDWKSVPDSPGVYRFLAKNGEVLYVGKATSLRDRIKSYFLQDLAIVRNALVAKVIEDAASVTWEEADSVLEALILEAKTIKKFMPVGNTDLKDNKSFSYLVVTKEKFPRFLVIRERELSVKAPKAIVEALFGPFMSAAQLREALKIVRKIFPFFDTPFKIGHRMSNFKKAEAKTLHFNQAIGRYPKELDEKEYKKTVKYLLTLFEGKKPVLLKTLEREMKNAAKEERFEDAAKLRGQVFALQHIRDITLIKDEYKIPESAEFRIEAYDIAHIRGASPRGVMTVVVDGEAVPAEYRTFTIRKAKAGDDYAALGEVIERRARHPEWPYPQLIVIDGGATHLKLAKQFLRLAKMEVETVSVVKDEKHRPKQVLGSPTLAHTHETSILLANAEAHRFALNRHRRARSRSLRNSIRPQKES